MQKLNFNFHSELNLNGKDKNLKKLNQNEVCHGRDLSIINVDIIKYYKKLITLSYDETAH